jgi:methylglutaconyl-CoA hydratase
MDCETLLFETDDRGVATLAMNRPAVNNAFNAAMIAEMTAAIAWAAAQDHVRLLVLTSTGQHFSAGADLNWMKGMAAMNLDDNRADADKLAQLMHTLYAFPKPSIARVTGAAYGGAVGLIASCDMAFAATDARFCLSEVKLGLAPAVISPYVINAMGARNSSRYFLTAEAFSAATAVSMGLLHDAVDSSVLNSHIDTIVSALLDNGPQALKACKQLIHTISAGGIEASVIDFTTDLIARLRVSAEGQEGLGAFLEKRTPHWQKRTPQ